MLIDYEYKIVVSEFIKKISNKSQKRIAFGLISMNNSKTLKQYVFTETLVLFNIYNKCGSNND